MERVFGSAIREEFRLDPDVVHLNHGAFGATPTAVAVAQRAWQDRFERQPTDFVEDQLTPALDAALDTLGGFVGARGDDLVFVDNATTAVNAVLYDLPLGPGDVVVTLEHVYGAVRNALGVRCTATGADLRIAPLPFPIDGPEQAVEALRDAIDARTALVVIDHVCSASALVLPVGDLVAVCREAGVPVLVDGAHAPGQHPLDLEALGADWYTGNLHKWLFAPKGCGILYARPERRPRHPVVSWEIGDDWHAAFHWPGTRDHSGWLAAPAGLEFLQRLGTGAARRWNTDLARDGARVLCEALGVDLPAPPELFGAMVTVPVPISGGHDVADALHRDLRAAHGIEVPVFAFAGGCWVRISAQVYNELSDYERLGRALSSAIA